MGPDSLWGRRRVCLKSLHKSRVLGLIMPIFSIPALPLFHYNLRALFKYEEENFLFCCRLVERSFSRILVNDRDSKTYLSRDKLTTATFNPEHHLFFLRSRSPFLSILVSLASARVQFLCGPAWYDDPFYLFLEFSLNFFLVTFLAQANFLSR